MRRVHEKRLCFDVLLADTQTERKTSKRSTLSTTQSGPLNN